MRIGVIDIETTNFFEKGGIIVEVGLLADDSQFRCTVCGQIGTVGRCCGLDTREPLNDLARAELVAEENRKANASNEAR
jgi:hypothetical protein